MPNDHDAMPDHSYYGTAAEPLPLLLHIETGSSVVIFMKAEQIARKDAARVQHLYGRVGLYRPWTFGGGHYRIRRFSNRAAGKRLATPVSTKSLTKPACVRRAWSSHTLVPLTAQPSRLFSGDRK